VGLLAGRRIRAAERQGPFDILHFHTQAAAYTSLARMRRTPAIVSIDCTQHLASQEAASRVAELSYRPNIIHDGFVFRAAAAITATSQWAGRDLAAVYPDCAAKLHVIPYPVNLDAFGRDWIDERRKRTRGADNRTRVLFIGGDFPRKGGPELLDAWCAGGFAGRAELDLVTDWPIRADEVPAGVNLVGGVQPYTDRWLDLWRRADLFVMPTRHEAFGMVFQEAAASGIPAVATRINAIPELVEDALTGLLVGPGDRRALAGAIGTLLDSPDLRHRMGSAARHRIERCGAPASYAAKLGSIIERLPRPEDDQRRAR
jgi:glycosyltransferase involved in cell wall biosynthesis